MMKLEQDYEVKPEPNAADQTARPEVIRKQRFSRRQYAMDLYMRGTPLPEIIKKTGLQSADLMNVIWYAKLREKASQIQEEVKREILSEKVPILKEITKMSLDCVKDWLIELQNPEVRAERLKSTRDIKDIANIATGLNEMLRLELGQEPQGLADTTKTAVMATEEVLEEMKAIDPVFDYEQGLLGEKEGSGGVKE